MFSRMGTTHTSLEVDKAVTRRHDGDYGILPVALFVYRVFGRRLKSKKISRSTEANSNGSPDASRRDAVVAR